MDLTFYITIAGKSTRMGADKAEQILGGKTFLERLTNTISDLGFTPFLITQEDVKVKNNLPCIPDYTPQIGPLGGLYQSLRHAETAYIVYLSCDIPLLPAEVLKLLMKQASSQACSMVCYKNKMYPLIGIYHKSILPVVSHQLKGKNYKMMDLIERVNARGVSVESWVNDEILLNCNNIDDLEKLKDYYNNCL